jgi:hypothetical protein
MIEDDEFQKVVCARSIQSPVRELEHFASTNGQMVIPLSDENSTILCRGAGVTALPIGIFIPKNGVIRILDTVRTKVLDWSLSLQAAGIQGEGPSFSPEEKATANNPRVTYNIANISNFSGNLGGNVGGNVNASSPQHVRSELHKLTSLIEQIRSLNGRLGLTAVAEKELFDHVASIDHELSKAEPETDSLTGFIRSIRKVCEGASGSLIAAGIASLAGNIHF